MSVCVEGLIKNDFYDLDNIEAVEAELYYTSKKLNDYFHLEGEDQYISGMDYGEYRVYSETHHMFMLILKKGYWHVCPGYRYHQMFTPPLFVRQGFYDIVKALEKKEIWYCDEFHLDNCGDDKWDYDKQSFEDWLAFINNKYGTIKEFPIEEVMSSNKTLFTAVPVYHDNFRKIKCIK